MKFVLVCVSVIAHIPADLSATGESLKKIDETEEDIPLMQEDADIFQEVGYCLYL